MKSTREHNRSIKNVGDFVEIFYCMWVRDIKLELCASLVLFPYQKFLGRGWENIYLINIQMSTFHAMLQNLYRKNNHNIFNSLERLVRCYSFPQIWIFWVCFFNKFLHIYVRICWQTVRVNVPKLFVLKK